jgi:Uncharacterized protein conserved in bacteria C-term(DUF2220)
MNGIHQRAVESAGLMPDSRSPEVLHVPLLIGEAYGRVKVRLPGLPAGVIAVTVPRTSPGGDRIPRDRKGRVRVTMVDLVAQGSVEAYSPPSTLSRQELIWVLETGSSRRWTTIETKFHERAWDISVDLIRAGAVVVRCDIDVLNFIPCSWRLTHAWASQSADLLQELRGRIPPDIARAQLLSLMSDIPELAEERMLLSKAEMGSPLRVPIGSRTRGNLWPVYEAAIRAASIWWPAQKTGNRRLTNRELAAKALGGSKNWTPARQQAFENLIGMPFDKAVDKAEYEIRLRGPLRWSIGSVIADASKGKPWIGLPAEGVRLVGRIQRSARGVLVIENSDTFQQVCQRQDISDTWLCVWGKGSVADGIVAFLKSMDDLPIVIWCDLDAYGIRIIHELSQRLGRNLIPVGMTVELYANGIKYRPDNPEESQRVARKMAEEGPQVLRALAHAIAELDGLGCEQETLYDDVLDALSSHLRDIERMAIAKNP